MGDIVRLSAEELVESAKGLAVLLQDAVEGGASVGFLAPLDLGTAAAWWESLAPAVAEGRMILWVARDGGEIIGTITLRLEQYPNGRHRGEIAKLLVHRMARGRGLGRDLLAIAERAAIEDGRTLLILDTETGSRAEELYRRKGWTPLGVVPGHAADPSGVLKPTTFFYKRLA
ncbi:GNAT family N-acetyltransferase [Microbispora sp. ATCC PTA-5024]|uniref:GNAT family N-acetyltransferase n=1 Tax=Microbispora sp. ATCC PTA-5024 TaxID=316330 RepID=UPI0003DCDFB0|nr:GNAT family N-acetyltransferase [Microbispora sp. ATCC PTA-5024]ETK34811.1 N-acetyltransferase [Microbispora sp. ATCC PTA-5024]